VLNALNQALLTELSDTINRVAVDDAVRVLLITGAGDKAFCAGADINELNALSSAEDARRFAERGQRILSQMEQLTKPVIMAINGYALGGGCEIAMAGDIRLAADTAALGQPEINIGVIPGFGGTQRLARLAGPGAARLLAFTGDRIPAAEALRLRLVDRVLPAAELLPAAMDMARKLAAKAPVALAAAKRAINEGLQVDLDRACVLEAALFGVVCDTEDRAEGTRAFLEKRQPCYRGC